MLHSISICRQISREFIKYRITSTFDAKSPKSDANTMGNRNILDFAAMFYAKSPKYEANTEGVGFKILHLILMQKLPKMRQIILGLAPTKIRTYYRNSQKLKTAILKSRQSPYQIASRKCLPLFYKLEAVLITLMTSL